MFFAHSVRNRLYKKDLEYRLCMECNIGWFYHLPVVIVISRAVFSSYMK